MAKAQCSVRMKSHSILSLFVCACVYIFSHLAELFLKQMCLLKYTFKILIKRQRQVMDRVNKCYYFYPKGMDCT